MIDSFIKYIRYEKQYSSYTVSSYKNDLEQFKAFCLTQFGCFSPADITMRQVREWLIALMEIGEKPTSVRRKISTLRSFYKFLNIKVITDANPMLKIIPPKQPRPLPKFFKEKDIDQLLHISENYCNFEAQRNLLIIEIIYQTGLRRSEAASLLDQDVSTAQMCIKVIGKGNKERIIPFGNDLRHRIEQYRNARNDQLNTPVTHFFVDANGQPLKPTKIYTIVRNEMSKVTTQEKRSPHVLRHTFATAMLNSGADISSIKELLGHSTLAATQIYTHLSFEQAMRIYELAHPRGTTNDDKE